MVYRIALFAHIAGVLIYFFGVGMELVVLRGLRRSRTLEQAGMWLQTARGTHKLFQLSALLILAAGLYMTLTAWGIWTPWIDVALGVLLVFNALGPLVNGRRFKAIGQAVGVVARQTNGSALTADLARKMNDPVLRASVHSMAAVSLGIVFLMTIKPDLVGSLVTIAVAALVGWLSALLPAARSQDSQAVPATAAVSDTEHARV